MIFPSLAVDFFCSPSFILCCNDWSPTFLLKTMWFPPKKVHLPFTPSGDKYDWFLRIFYSIVTNFDFHWPVFPRLDSREYLCTWVTLQRGHLSRTLCISHRCVFYRLLGNWGDISKPVINRIGNHVHVLYRYIAIAGNRSRCSGSQSVAEVLAVSVVKVVGKEKNKL